MTALLGALVGVGLAFTTAPARATEPAPDAGAKPAAAWQTGLSDDDLRVRIREGGSTTKDGVTLEMKAFEDALTPEQLDGVVSYVRWLGAPR